MIDMKEVSGLHKSGLNCAQVVAVLCGRQAGADEAAVKAAMGGFGGGLRCGEVCGAVSGGVFSLGMRFPCTDGGDLEAKKKIADLTIRFTDSFRAKYGCITCRDLTEKAGRERCEEFMAYCARLVQEMSREERRE